MKGIDLGEGLTSNVRATGIVTAVIAGPTQSKAEEDILKAVKWADLLELRLDLFEELSFEGIRSLMQISTKPLLFKITDEHIDYLSLNPEYVDVDFRSAPQVTSLGYKGHLIASMHHFDAFPQNLEELYRDLVNSGAHSFKLAAMTFSATEALKLATFRRPALTTIAMGRVGAFTRLMAPLLSQPFQYFLPRRSNLEELGLFTYEEACEVYNYPDLSPKTKLCALIGSMVEKSRSHLKHNRKFKELGEDALFIKITVMPSELSSFFSYLDYFQGLAVTIPHKEKVLPFLKHVEEKALSIGAVNTITKGRGANTDAEGALNAIEKRGKVAGKKIVILGSGGCARAIAFEAKNRGARVTVLGRNKTAVQDLARDFTIEGEMLRAIAHHLDYDILVNATPVGMGEGASKAPIPLDFIQKGKLVFDAITVPEITPLLAHAKSLGCPIVTGAEMFEEQAIGQYERWLYHSQEINS